MSSIENKLIETINNLNSLQEMLNKDTDSEWICDASDDAVHSLLQMKALIEAIHGDGAFRKNSKQKIAEDNENDITTMTYELHIYEEDSSPIVNFEKKLDS